MGASYVVLRDQSRTMRRVPINRAMVRTSDAVAMGSPSAPTVAAQPPSPKIEMLQNPSASDIADLSRDENVLGFARHIPITQIEPADKGISDVVSPDAGPTWGVAAVGADKSVRFNGQSATVAVIDSGIRADHDAFRGIQFISKDFTGTGSVVDQSGHGTHCAATIAGREVSGCRIGVAPGVEKLLIGRIFAPGVSTTSEMVVNALNWAVENGADVISMSLNFDFTGLVEELISAGLPPRAATAQALVEFQNNLRLFDNLTDLFRAQEAFPGKRGTVIVGSAGNQSMLEPTDGKAPFSVPVGAPCNSIGIISVGAARRAQNGLLDIAPFSNSAPTLIAPGVEIFSADALAVSTSGLVSKSGTSMACPHVAGLAALWWDAISLGQLQLKAAVVSTKLQASCRLDGLNPGLEEGARGLGLPRAPQ